MPELKREALYYSIISGKTLRCELCPHHCVLTDSEMGLCRSRINLSGKMYAANYARAAALAVDPIEKKPLYHFYPGSRILSLGPNSCNLQCKFCQNYHISQFEAPTQEISIEGLRAAIDDYTPGSPRIAFTYTEPLTWYEYILDFGERFPEVEIALITNGYLNETPFHKLLPVVSALNIDLKGMRDSFYRNYCGGDLHTVLTNIEVCVDHGKHLELTLLLIPGLNDAKADILAMADFISALNPDIPLHISAYHPSYQMTNHATGIDDVKRAIDLCKTKLNYVYGGNLGIEDYMHTQCKVCGKGIISRSYSSISSQINTAGRCPYCDTAIYGVYEK